MEPLFISQEEFWTWFNRDPLSDISATNEGAAFTEDIPAKKKMRKEGPLRHIVETEAATKKGIRYDIMYGRQRPGKKTKVWEGDGYLTLVGSMAYLCNTSGKMLEEPSIMDDIDMKSIEDLGELLIGTTEVQVVEVSRN